LFRSLSTNCLIMQPLFGDQFGVDAQYQDKQYNYNQYGFETEAGLSYLRAITGRLFEEHSLDDLKIIICAYSCTYHRQEYQPMIITRFYGSNQHIKFSLEACC